MSGLEEIIAIGIGSGAMTMGLMKGFKKMFNIKNVSCSCDGNEDHCICGLKIKKYTKEKEKEKDRTAAASPLGKEKEEVSLD